MLFMAASTSGMVKIVAEPILASPATCSPHCSGTYGIEQLAHEKAVQILICWSGTGGKRFAAGYQSVIFRKSFMRRLITTLLYVLLASIAIGQTKTAKSVCAECIRRNMEYLASDELHGRGSGTEDEHQAAEYIGEQLKAAGVLHGVDQGYVERAATVHHLINAPPQLKVGTVAGTGAKTFVYGKDFLTIYLYTARFSGPLLKIDADNYDGKVSRGTVVLVKGKDARKERDVALNAIQAGAAGALVLAVDSSAEYFSWGVDHLPNLPPTLEHHANVELGGNLNVLEISKSAVEYVTQVPDGTPIEFVAPTTDTPGFTWNAIGILPGADAILRNSAVLFSAHLDHLGTGKMVKGDKIYNGADDDASGTSAVLEIARVLGSGQRPKRTVIFAFFGSEEKGGLGSTFFCDHPPLPLSQIAASMELEMIGRPDPALKNAPLWVSGWERSDLGPALVQHGAQLLADPHPQEVFYTRSDNYVLAKRGVVAHTISSFGLHSDYHQPSDDLSHINFDHLDEAVNSLLAPIEWLVNSEFKPQWKEGGQP